MCVCVKFYVLNCIFSPKKTETFKHTHTHCLSISSKLYLIICVCVCVLVCVVYSNYFNFKQYKNLRRFKS